MIDFVENEQSTQEPQHEQVLQPIPEPQNNIIIKVIGVGGGGGNAVNNMYRQGIKDVNFAICNTDVQALQNSPVTRKIYIGEIGAGGKPEVARKAALEHKDEIRAELEDGTKMLFITAGMGGGTGTGASPVIAEIAKQIELNDRNIKRMLVVGVVTTPFTFEGRAKAALAEEGINQLKKNVDSILVINNNKLRSSFGNLKLTDGFKVADDVLYTGVKGISEIITVKAYVNVDFSDVNSVMQMSGTALLGTGVGKGENRAIEAVKAASTSVLLNDSSINGAKNVLLYIAFSSKNEISIDEMGAMTDYISTLTGGDETSVIWGVGADDSLDDEVKVTLVATGFESNQNPEKIVHTIPQTPPDTTPKTPIPQVPDLPEGWTYERREPAKKVDYVDETNSDTKAEATQPVKEPLKPTDTQVAEQPKNVVSEPKEVPTSTTTSQTEQSNRQQTLPLYPENTLNSNHVAPSAQAEQRIEPQTASTDTQRRVYDINGNPLNISGNAANKPFDNTPHNDTPAPRPAVNDVTLHRNQPSAQINEGFTQPQQPTAATTNNATVGVQTDVQTISKPVATTPERPTNIQLTGSTMTQQDKNAVDRAHRMMRAQRLNDVLHNRVDGAKIVEGITTEEMKNGSFLLQIPHSSQPESYININSNGDTVENPYLTPKKGTD